MPQVRKYWKIFEKTQERLDIAQAKFRKQNGFQFRLVFCFIFNFFFEKGQFRKYYPPGHSEKGQKILFEISENLFNDLCALGVFSRCLDTLGERKNGVYVDLYCR